MKAQYDVAVRRLLKQFRVATEFELYSGWAMSKPAVGSDYKRQEDLGQQFDTLKQRFREMCIETAGEAAGGRLEELVAAIYKVTEDEVKGFLAEAEAEGETLEFTPRAMPLISFPWIFHWILVKIAKGDQYRPLETSLAPATRIAPLVTPVTPCEADVGVSKEADGQKTPQSKNPGEKTREAAHVDGEIDLIDFDADVVESKPETSGDAQKGIDAPDEAAKTDRDPPEETAEAIESLQSTTNSEMTPSKSGSEPHSTNPEASDNETPLDSVNAPVSAVPITRHLEYRESSMDQLLRLYEDSDED